MREVKAKPSSRIAYGAAMAIEKKNRIGRQEWEREDFRAELGFAELPLLLDMPRWSRVLFPQYCIPMHLWCFMYYMRVLIPFPFVTLLFLRLLKSNKFQVILVSKTLIVLLPFYNWIRFGLLFWFYSVKVLVW